jgi:hypothetical protein
MYFILRPYFVKINVPYTNNSPPPPPRGPTASQGRAPQFGNLSTNLMVLRGRHCNSEACLEGPDNKILSVHQLKTLAGMRRGGWCHGMRQRERERDIYIKARVTFDATIHSEKMFFAMNNKASLPSANTSNKCRLISSTTSPTWQKR